VLDLLRLCQNGKPEAGLPVWRLNMIHEIIQERCQRLSDKNRDIPLVWSIMHMYTTMQLAKIYAIKRNLNPELAGLVCVFHDIHSLHTGEHENHGERAAPYIKEIIQQYNMRWGSEIGVISEDEVETIVQAIRVHSDKTSVSDEPYTELLKDIDSLDAYLNGMEPWEKSSRLQRVKSALKELTLEMHS